MTQSKPQFETTRWTLVLQAATGGDSDGKPALEELIRRYWHPLYSFARHQGLSRADAEDATQDFLCRAIDENLLASADPTRGKFRTFLLTVWKRFLIDEYRKRSRQKRGGASMLLSIDFGMGEEQFQAMRAPKVDSDRTFMASWAKSILEEAKRRLRIDYEERGKGAVCDFLLARITEPTSNQDYAMAAAELSLSPTAVKVALHRLRQRFGSTLREIVLETIDDPSEVDQELQELLAALCMLPTIE